MSSEEDVRRYFERVLKKEGVKILKPIECEMRNFEDLTHFECVTYTDKKIDKQVGYFLGYGKIYSLEWQEQCDGKPCWRTIFMLNDYNE